MRHVYELTDLSMPPGQQQCVAKVSKDPLERRETYFAEVEMQFKCKDLAAQYNATSPPKRIDFVTPCVIEFTRRRTACGAPLVALVEPMLKGCYAKHSNNFGFVDTTLDRNTPQAFSHWTWVTSRGQLLVCDIQGVGDMFTDPQIHSNAGHNNFLYGRGDMGIEGIRRFFQSHRCNALCRSLGLPPVPGSEVLGLLPRIESGTTARGRPMSPALDLFSHPTSYSPATLSPASSVGGISIASGIGDIFAPRMFPVIADFGMTLPLVTIPAPPIVIAI